MIPTPELDKLQLIRTKSQAIGAFLEWLGDNGKVIGFYSGNHFVPDHKSIEAWLAEYFRIDLNKVEQEKRALLAELRKGAES